MDTESDPPNYTVEELTRLIEDLKHEEPEARLESSRQLVTVATALGPKRTRSELMPYLAESVDDEDEILEIVCEQMANFVPLVGGGAFAFSLLPVFEAIASGEEVALRQLAIKGLTALIPQMPAEHVRTYVFDVVRRLAKGHWYAQRSSVCGLLHVVYPGLDAAGQAEVLGVVGVLSTDAAAMVRRSLAENLVHLIPLVAPAAVKTHLHPVFLQLTKDDQDSVRMLAAALCVPMAKAVAPDEIAAAVIPAFQACAADAAWRVRYNIAVHFADLQIAVGPALTNTALFPAFVVLLGDSEAEVRTAISLKLLMFSRNLSDDVRVAKTLSDVVPKIQTLVVDESQHVRSAVASVIMGLAMLLGKDNTITYLLPMFLTLLKDEFSEVRLNIISNLDEVGKCIGIDQLSAALKPAINELAQHDEWRVRQSIIDHIPSVARQLGVAFFDAELKELCLSWLEDKVYTVRRAAVDNIKKIIEMFGIEWAIAAGSVLPRVLNTSSGTASYAARLVAVFTIDSLIAICPQEVVLNYLVPPLCNHLYTDKVANIRFNVAKTLEKLLPHVTKGVFQAQIKTVLETMKRDADRDVKYFAGRALAQAGILNLA